jgi:hypothetical protein
MVSEYEQLVRELRAATRKQAAAEKSVEMRKSHGPKVYTGDMTTIRRTIAALTRKVKPFRKSMADDGHPLVLALKPVLDLQAARVRFAELNAQITRQASSGEITAVDAARIEGELARLGDLIQQLEGTSVESGADANARNRRLPQ